MAFRVWFLPLNSIGMDVVNNTAVTWPSDVPVLGGTRRVYPLSDDGHSGSFSFFCPSFSRNRFRVPDSQGCGVQTASTAAPWAEAAEKPFAELDLGGWGREGSAEGVREVQPGGRGGGELLPAGGTWAWRVAPQLPCRKHLAGLCVHAGLQRSVQWPVRATPPSASSLSWAGPAVCCAWASRDWGPLQDLSVQPLGLRVLFRLSAWLRHLSLWLVFLVSSMFWWTGLGPSCWAPPQSRSGGESWFLPDPALASPLLMPSPCPTIWPICLAGVCPVGTVTFGQKRACVTCCPPGRGCG